MTNDYAALDAEIIESIRDGCNKAGKLTARLVLVAQPFKTADRCARRVIDGRLQALRKAGRIVPRREGRARVWEVVA